MVTLRETNTLCITNHYNNKDTVISSRTTIQSSWKEQGPQTVKHPTNTMLKKITYIHPVISAPNTAM